MNSSNDRRTGPNLLWKLFGWLMKERRSGIDRRGSATEKRRA